MSVAILCALLALCLFQVVESRTRRVGGLVFFRFGRFGGSVYLARARAEP